MNLSAEAKAKELYGYFNKYRFMINPVDAKIMAIKIANEFINNHAITDVNYSHSIHDEGTKDYWREVKRVLIHEIKPVVSFGEEPPVSKDPLYGC